MMDANEIALQKHLQEQEQRERFLDMFENGIETELETIRANIKIIRKKASDYHGYDFQDEAEEFIQDLI